MYKSKDGKIYSLNDITEALRKCNDNASDAGRKLGIPASSIRDMRRRLLKDSPPSSLDDEFEVPLLPTGQLSIEQILSRKRVKFDAVLKARVASKLVPIKVLVDGPIGIMHMADPHIDNDGCDIGKIEKHVDLIQKTEGLMAGNAGDFQDNWVGRLSRLYENSSTTHQEAWQLVEWLVTSVKWLYLVAGNHDLWCGGSNPLDWIVKQSVVGHYDAHGTRIELILPSGKKCVINARHDFKGYSQWNPAHGVMKAAQMGWRDHILISGHKHISSHNYLKDPMSGRITHAIQVSSYKTVDDFAQELGAQDQDMFCAPITIIDPQYNEDDIRFIRFEPDPEEGAEILTFLRKRWKAGRSCKL